MRTHILCFVLSLAACGPNANPSALVASDKPLLAEDHWTACTRADDGKTLVTVQFVARTNEGTPLGDGEVAVELKVNGDPIDSESILDSGAEELSSSLDLHLVLDTSYSMVVAGAFGRMLEAAEGLVNQVDASYQSRPGVFTWTVGWFAEVLDDAVGDWQPHDIATLPQPPAGTATKLFAAVEHSALLMDQAFASDIATGDRDRRVMVVFSDGLDNYSWWDNSDWVATGETPSGAQYAEIGWPPATIQDAITGIRFDPGRTVYVLGFGDALGAAEADLEAIAAAGNGAYSYEQDDVETLFADLADQFTTLQTVGALVPLPPGQYTFEAEVHEGSLDGPSESLTWDLNAGTLALCP